MSNYYHRVTCAHVGMYTYKVRSHTHTMVTSILWTVVFVLLCKIVGHILLAWGPGARQYHDKYMQNGQIISHLFCAWCLRDLQTCFWIRHEHTMGQRCQQLRYGCRNPSAQGTDHQHVQPLLCFRRLISDESCYVRLTKHLHGKTKMCLADHTCMKLQGRVQLYAGSCVYWWTKWGVTD